MPADNTLTEIFPKSNPSLARTGAAVTWARTGRRAGRPRESAEKLVWHGGNSIARPSRTSLVSLVDLVCFVYLVDLVHLVSFVQPKNQIDQTNQIDKMNQMNQMPVIPK